MNRGHLNLQTISTTLTDVTFWTVFRLRPNTRAASRRLRPSRNTKRRTATVRTVRVKGDGEGRWDSHAQTTETILVWSGDFRVEFRDQALELSQGHCCVVPVGTEHRGTSSDGAEVILFQHSP